MLLLLENHDVPGIVGQIGTVLGAHSVNIANMSLSRDHRGGEVLTVLNLDSVPDEAILESLLTNPNIRSARVGDYKGCSNAKSPSPFSPSFVLGSLRKVHQHRPRRFSDR